MSSSGRPAATSVPNATSSSASVSGQDSSSDLSIAALLAALKSDHIAAGPVRRTVDAGRRQPREAGLEPAGRLHHLVRRARPPGRRRPPCAPSDACLPRREHARHRRVAAKDRSDTRERRAHRRLACADRRRRPRARSVPRPGKLRLERVAGGHGLRVERLPAGARQRAVGERRERAQDQDDAAPGDRDRPAVIGRPGAQAPEPPVIGRLRRWLPAFHSPECTAARLGAGRTPAKGVATQNPGIVSLHARRDNAGWLACAPASCSSRCSSAPSCRRPRTPARASSSTRT